MIFEAIMLICFGLAWPLSVWKSLMSKSNDGKSIWFLIVCFIGYLSGITYKILFNMNIVLYLYIINCCMIVVDIFLFMRNKNYNSSSI
ncbi:MAG: hypothetical protein PHQ52_05300 [Candidatus Omnitrophica bacterium]|nr:hypothetical protein [Candidatus Omnitrophota bacterium]